MLRGGAGGDFVDHQAIRTWTRELAHELEGAALAAV
jgi:hypothetical protein